MPTKALLFWAALLLIATGLQGCASPATVQGMVAPVNTIKTQPFAVTVNTRGGNETGAMDPSMISDADFAKAIEESIINGHVFTKVVHGKDSDYELGVTLLTFNKPMFGASFTITLETGWSLTNTKTREIALRKNIKSTHTASFSDSAVGVTRFRLALEGAARENIRNGLEEISRLPLK
jgi:hypothetical protein